MIVRIELNKILHNRSVQPLTLFETSQPFHSLWAARFFRDKLNRVGPKNKSAGYSLRNFRQRFRVLRTMRIGQRVMLTLYVPPPTLIGLSFYLKNDGAKRPSTHT
jgi:hypothetical protein